MSLDERIRAQAAVLPAALKELLDAELASGNSVIDVAFGSGEKAGWVSLVLERPFHHPAASPPPGTSYLETDEDGRRIAEFAAIGGHFSLVNRSTVTTAPSAARRFIDSMTMTFDMWHDGTGYDLDALRAVPEGVIPALEALLIAKQPRDWRDIEALQAIGTPNAVQAIQEALSDQDPSVRRQAAVTAGPADDRRREALLLRALTSAVFFDGLSEALEEAEEFHPPKVIDALLRGALSREGEVAVHFAALLYFLHGKSKEAFDWDHRPFFLRFHTTDPVERRNAFHELCAAIGVDSGKYRQTS